MKIVIVIMLALFPCMEVWGQDSEKCEKEQEVAQRWLMSKGMAEPKLQVELSNDNLVVFDCKRTKGFCVVARADVWGKLRQPVLAYSLDNYMRGVSGETYGVLLGLYEKQIETLRQTSVPLGVSEARTDTVPPLLGSMRWEQGTPYNAHSPHFGKWRIPIGCVPLAMGMVMRYHEWPQQGTSDVFIHPEGLDVLRYDFSKLKPQWSDYADQYSTRDTTTALVSLSRTLGTLSLCTDPGISASAVSKNLREVKHLFVNNLRYSGRVAYVPLQKVPVYKVDSLLRSEINAHRPCIVSRGKHSFVCDGFDGDFFHFNLGWSGNHNGYYRLDIVPQQETKGIMNAIVYGLEPQREEVVREVQLTKPNTLSNALPEEELQRVTSLTIVGPVGGEDVRLLRKMAGAVEGDALPCYPWGALRRLDLSQAKLVKGKAAYTTRLATGTRSKTWTTNDGVGTYQKKKTFDLENMDDKAWRDFKAMFGSSTDGVFYTRTSDGRCWENYYITANQTLGTYMFAGCSSLSEIILPEGLKYIGYDAFLQCQSLQSMRVPRTTKELGNVPFNSCLSLAELWLPKGIKVNKRFVDHCSHGLKINYYE